MSDDQKRVAVQYNYALGGAPFKCIFFDITEHVTVVNAMEGSEGGSQMSKFQPVKNSYGMHPNGKMPWCRR